MKLGNYELKKNKEGHEFGGYLYLRGTGITSLPENLTVGGSLDLEGCTGITSLPENLTVGGSLDLRGTGITGQKPRKKLSINFHTELKTSLDLDNKLSWENGKYRKIDGIFCEILNKVKNVFKVKIGLNIKYIVTDGDNYSHGDTIKQAKEDLIYKISNRDKSKFESMSISTVLSLRECIEMYRIITGACEAGVKGFINNLESVKENYSIADIIDITNGQYGNDALVDFFK